jgi:hypothetical protein
MGTLNPHLLAGAPDLIPGDRERLASSGPPDTGLRQPSGSGSSMTRLPAERVDETSKATSKPAPSLRAPPRQAGGEALLPAGPTASPATVSASRHPAPAGTPHGHRRTGGLRSPPMGDPGGHKNLTIRAAREEDHLSIGQPPWLDAHSQVGIERGQARACLDFGGCRRTVSAGPLQDTPCVMTCELGFETRRPRITRKCGGRAEASCYSEPSTRGRAGARARLLLARKYFTPSTVR